MSEFKVSCYEESINELGRQLCSLKLLLKIGILIKNGKTEDCNTALFREFSRLPYPIFVNIVYIGCNTNATMLKYMSMVSEFERNLEKEFPKVDETREVYLYLANQKQSSFYVEELQCGKFVLASAIFGKYEQPRFVCSICNRSELEEFDMVTYEKYVLSVCGNCAKYKPKIAMEKMEEQKVIIEVKEKKEKELMKYYRQETKAQSILKAMDSIEETMIKNKSRGLENAEEINTLKRKIQVLEIENDVLEDENNNLKTKKSKLQEEYTEERRLVEVYYHEIKHLL